MYRHCILLMLLFEVENILILLMVNIPARRIKFCEVSEAC